MRQISEGNTELCELAYKYGADKCPQFGHPYTPFYYELFKDTKNDVKKVLEMGIGNLQRKFIKTCLWYEPGASMRMWRDFFPNAQIYAADILPEVMFEEDRIETFVCDERKKSDVRRLIEKTGSDIDIFIDDGDHNLQSQIELAEYALEVLDPGVTYIVEDVNYADSIVAQLSKRYSCWVPQLPGRRLRSHKVVIIEK